MKEKRKENANQRCGEERNERKIEEKKTTGLYIASKATRNLLVLLFSFFILNFSLGCATKVKIVELENKGTSMKVDTPDWVKNGINGVSHVQAMPEFRDKYCVIGSESGVNKQFVLAWADNFSAQQQIGAMLRTTIASEYQAKRIASGQSVGGSNSELSSQEVNQQMDDIINAIVNVSYSGAQREADWWVLNRRYDPDQKDVYTDTYTAYVLYTIPKAEMNRQVARAMETSVRADSALYDITIEIARQILQDGMKSWGE